MYKNSKTIEWNIYIKLDLTQEKVKEVSSA